MEEVADELKTHEHQNEAADKMNGNACQEADGSENSESTPVSDDICKMKSKLPDLQSPQENKEETSLSNESSTQLEASSSQDSSTKEASPISADPSAVESASDGISKVDENAAHVSNEMSIDDVEKDKCLGSEESMEVESLKESDPILCEPQEESPDGKTHTSNPIHVSSPVTVAEQDETSANTDLANSESPAENTENNAEIADPGSPAEIIESSSLKDAEVQDSGGDDAANSKSIPEDSEDKSMDHNDIDNHSDVSARTDGNSSEPTETTRFLNIDQDSVADEDDAELDARASLENVEDPFSTEHEESSEVGKTAEEVEESSEAPEVDEPEESLKSSGESSEVRKTTNDIEESSELEKAAEGVDESSEVEKTTDDVEESSEVEKASDDVEESCEGGKTSERAEESSELEKTTEGAEESSEVSETVEEPEESSEPRESTEELEESTEAEKSTEVVEEPSEVPETIENPEEPLEAREPKKPEEASEVGKTPKEEESPDVSKTIEEAEESTEGREMTCEPEETFEVTKGGEEVKESSELTETTKHAEDSNETQTEGDPETAKLTGAVSESKDVTEDEDVNDTTEAQKESSEAAKTQDESMDVAKSPEASTDAAKSSKESTDESDGAVGGAAKDVGSAEKPAAEPELMEIDDSSETDTVISTESTTSRKTRKYETKATKHEKSSSKVADPEAEEVIIDDDDEEKVEEKPGKMTRRSKATSKGKTKSSNVESGDTETICIVPDLPEIESVTSLATSTKAEKKEKPSPVFQSGRTQRRAAKTAGIKLKKMMAESMSDTVEEAPGKNAVQPVEKSVNSANFVRKCAECKSRLVMSESCLFWETMEFCDEGCLGSYLKKLGKFCANCKGDVQAASLGKYCVRFGTDINQFCCSTCLEEFKKGLKVCSYCQKDISSGPEGFLAPVGDKGQFKDFCSQECMVLYEAISNNIPEPTEMQVCTVCNNERLVEVKVRLNKKETKLCSEVCFAAFKFANSIECDKCNMCRKYYHDGHNYVIYYEDELHTFCSKTCMNVYILGKRRIILCNTCKVKKYNFDMIKRVLSNGTTVMACSLNCLALYQSQKTSPSSRTSPCDNCGLSKAVQYHLNMSDSSVRNFCSLICVMNFQTQSKVKRSGVYPLGGPKRASSHKKSAASDASVPVISTVTSLAQTNGPKANSHSPAPSKTAAGKTGVIQQIVMRPPLPKPVHNKIIQCRPSHNTKGVSCKPFMTTKSTQTEKEDAKPVLIPIPVPIFVPLPCAMYKLPVPFAMPIPLPIPVPIFVPTTRNSAKGIMKQIAKIQKKIPKDPYEAELLMMAEMVAGEKKTDETSSSEEDDDNDNIGDASIADVSLHNESEDEARAPSSAGNQSPAVSTRSSISCKAPLLDDLTDIEDSLKPATIVPTERPPSEHSRDIEPPSPPIPKKARKRTSNAGLGAEALGVKRIRRSQDNQETSPTAPSPPLEIIRADANMNLKYTYGVNAWRQWVLMKNVDLEKTGAKNNRKPILFKTDLLKLTPDELSYALCLFLKEVKKPNGTEYAPDTLFYFCLGIQHYLYENGRVDNLFTDPFYESFTDRLDEVGIKFASMYDGTRQIVTRIEEEHLWESKQLGAHSPHVLLNTLMFFNTKHFNLATVDEHMQLSFAHIMKHWKRNSGGAAVPASSKNQPPGNRNVLLRFYPLQSTIDGNSRKKKMYEQKENEDNPLRCPVKLYEFYLSKCPESVKTRNDVFYLLPERSCVPDSPVWYSTMALDKKPLVKMLNRIKMVKEVNIALLTL